MRNESRPVLRYNTSDFMRNNNEKLNIICFSNQLWDFPLWTNKRHVMSRLGKRGHRVLFVDPPINTGRLFFKQLREKKWPLQRLFSWIYKGQENVLVFSPLRFVPANKYLTKLFCNRISGVVKKHFSINNKTVLWVYNVEIENIDLILSNIKYDILIYDCVDNYPAFPRYDTAEKKNHIIMQEDFLARKADLVFGTAPGLVNKLLPLNENTFYTPNVGDYESFSKVKNDNNGIPEDMVSIPKPRIGFTGAVDDYKFDVTLVKNIASDYPSYSFVIIGPMALKDREASARELGLDKLNNVYFLGSRDYSLMPCYYNGFDVMMIPYKLNDYTVGGCFPVKFHESLAAGLPVVVTDLPAYRPFGNVCYISKSDNEFSQNIRRALEEDSPSRRNERRSVAKENSWEGKVDRMLELIWKALKN